MLLGQNYYYYYLSLFMIKMDEEMISENVQEYH